MLNDALQAAGVTRSVGASNENDDGTLLDEFFVPSPMPEVKLQNFGGKLAVTEWEPVEPGFS